jgi:transposase
MRRDKHIYVGIDLHKFQHTAVILDCWFEKLGEVTFENKPSAFPSLLEYVNRFLTEGITPVFGLEDVGGYGRDLALYLKEKGYIVKFVNSSLSNAERNSYAMTQKYDSWDAQCVANVLIRQLPYLPDAIPSDLYWMIAQLVGRRNALVKSQTALKNQLHLQLSFHYPS